MEDTTRSTPSPFSVNSDPEEARLEARETHKYLLAKSYFDCREFERCAAVFLPSGIPSGPFLASSSTPRAASPLSSSKGKSKETNTYGSPDKGTPALNGRPLSQKALFLALYAKYMAGEKKKEEATEMILGPADKSSTVNPELVEVSRIIDKYFEIRGMEKASGGWLEYLQGIVYAKSKYYDAAKKWLVRSVHLYPYNWGAWLELSDLMNSVDEVGRHSDLNEVKLTLLAKPNSTRTTSKHHDDDVRPVRQPSPLSEH